MKKRIVLCADDYGQAPGISLGIINLLQQGRLSAISCIVNSTYWQKHASWLVAYQPHIDIGLHFNLTEGQALSTDYRQAYGEHFMPLSKLLRHAFMRRISCSVIVAELHAQIDHFQDAAGFPPRYLDGHQHIHQFPVIRNAVIEVYKQRLRSQQAYVRLVDERLNMLNIFRDFKKLVIKATGTKALKRLLKANNIPHNTSFAGIYAFEQAKFYPQLFLSFLQQIESGGLIMCHPGLGYASDEDSIGQARLAEYQYFTSDQFLKDCQAHHIEIAPFS